MTLRLQSAAKLQWSLARISRNNDRVHRRVRKNLLHIAKRADCLQSGAFPLMSGTRIGRQLVTAGFHEGLGHLQPVGMISQECKTHASILSPRKLSFRARGTMASLHSPSAKHKPANRLRSAAGPGS